MDFRQYFNALSILIHRVNILYLLSIWYNIYIYPCLIIGFILHVKLFVLTYDNNTTLTKWILSINTTLWDTICLKVHSFFSFVIPSFLNWINILTNLLLKINIFNVYFLYVFPGLMGTIKFLLREDASLLIFFLSFIWACSRIAIYLLTSPVSLVCKHWSCNSSIIVIRAHYFLII